MSKQGSRAVDELLPHARAVSVVVILNDKSALDRMRD